MALLIAAIAIVVVLLLALLFVFANGTRSRNKGLAKGTPPRVTKERDEKRIAGID